jgi:hypothetical protein
MDREALIAEAVQQGYQAETLQRQPTYAIVSMLQDKRHQPHDDVSRRSSRSAKPGREGKHGRDAARKVREAVGRIEDTKFDQDDDTATVVDMSYMVNTDNPADQKYVRFTDLVKMKKQFMQGLHTNSKLLKSNRDQMDEDDIEVSKRELQAIQKHLQLVNTEIREIQQWFAEAHAMKEAFYQQYLQKSVDVTGNLTDHFQRKLERIQHYNEAMQEQAKLSDKDL